MPALCLRRGLRARSVLFAGALGVSIQVLAVRLYAWTLRDGFRADFR